MAQPTSYLKYIYVVLGLLVADGIISLAFLSTMVNFLHTVGSGPYRIRSDDAGFLMHGEPAGLMTNQGHTTNAAGGTAVVLLGFGGLIALIAENRSRKRNGQSSTLFSAWAVATILSWLLTFSALVYTNVVTKQTAWPQNIDLEVLHDNPFPAKYPLDKWTPENWYKRVLDLPWQPDQQALRKAITQNLRIQVGWRYNLIALFILGFILMCLAVLEVITARKNKGRYGRASSAELEK